MPAHTRVRRSAAASKHATAAGAGGVDGAVIVDEGEVIGAGRGKDRIAEAEKAGVKSVPALVIDGNVLHINYGASLDDVKKLVA